LCATISILIDLFHFKLAFLQPWPSPHDREAHRLDLLIAFSLWHLLATICNDQSFAVDIEKQDLMTLPKKILLAQCIILNRHVPMNYF
jgi:hypothetical protein